jgi:hypothetical protein
MPQKDETPTLQSEQKERARAPSRKFSAERDNEFTWLTKNLPSEPVSSRWPQAEMTIPVDDPILGTTPSLRCLDIQYFGQHLARHRVCNDSSKRKRAGIMKLCTWKSAVDALTGIGTAIIGTAALERTSDTWPTILVVVGIYAAASGIRGLRC